MQRFFPAQGPAKRPTQEVRHWLRGTRANYRCGGLRQEAPGKYRDRRLRRIAQFASEGASGGLLSRVRGRTKPPSPARP